VKARSSITEASSSPHRKQNFCVTLGDARLDIFDWPVGRFDRCPRVNDIGVPGSFVPRLSPPCEFTDHTRFRIGGRVPSSCAYKPGPSTAKRRTTHARAIRVPVSRLSNIHITVLARRYSERDYLFISPAVTGLKSYRLNSDVHASANGAFDIDIGDWERIIFSEGAGRASFCHENFDETGKRISCNLWALEKRWE